MSKWSEFTDALYEVQIKKGTVLLNVMSWVWWFIWVILETIAKMLLGAIAFFLLFTTIVILIVCMKWVVIAGLSVLFVSAIYFLGSSIIERLVDHITRL